MKNHWLKEKPVKFTSKFQEANINTNGRIYSDNVLKDAVEVYKKQVITTGSWTLTKISKID